MLKVKLIIIIHTIHVFIHIKEKNTGKKRNDWQFFINFCLSLTNTI